MKKEDGGIVPPPSLLFAEGLAVCALIHSGIQLVGAHQNPVQRAIVFGFAVMCAFLNGAFDALVCFAAHNVSSFELDSRLV